MMHRRFHSLLTFLVLAALATVAPRAIAAEPTPDGEDGPRKAKVLLLGIDGLDPELVRRWTADGSMPNLAKLIDRGTLTEIECVVGTSSPVVWTTVATGVPPTVHGITGFRIGDDPVNSSHRKRPTFWNILSERDIDLATVGWMVTWPAENDVGLMVSDRAWRGQFKNDVTPPGLLKPLRHVPHIRRDEILDKFTTYEFDREWKSLDEDDPRYSVHYLLQNRLLNIFRRDSIYSGSALEIARKRDLDVLAVYLQGTDYVGHGFWQWFEPEPFQKNRWEIPAEQIEALGDVIPAYYRHVDEIAGRLLPLIDEDALVILLSDHGFRASAKKRSADDYSVEARFLSGGHRKNATLILSGPQVDKGAQPKREITHFDILPTLLYALDLPQARDHRGRPLTELFTEEYAAGRTKQTIETYATNDDEKKPVARSDLDGEIIEELRSLGYVR
ncbi:MAG: alkaline phosphatase family protein [Candidatus Binatia bacterium]|nr:alkaline phosphatase family protein [Candidatus Binatia bacterium]